MSSEPPNAAVPARTVPPPQPLNLRGFPQAILHMDADAFFTSVEQALTPALRGRPVVTGEERGIIACASYEAKARGIARGLPLHEARQLCPGLVILPSDYETYGLYSRRMFNILRRYTPAVEEYSIDEAFADLTGLRRVHRCPYEEIARRIQADVRAELGFGVSIGVSLSRTLAKLCSKFRKPNGITAVRGRHIHLLLARTSIDKVWGIGPNGAALLRKFGVATAYDFVRRPEEWVTNLLHKPGRETWFELQGHPMHAVNPTPKSTYGNIMKSHTFSPPTADRALVYAELLHNVEAACARLRRLRLRAGVVGMGLRQQDFQHAGGETPLSRPTALDGEVLPAIRELFDRAFQPGTVYRATLVLFGALEDDRTEQLDLFANYSHHDALRRLAERTDALNRRFGRGTVQCGALLELARKPVARRDTPPERLGDLFDGETERRHLAIPRMTGVNV